MFSTWLHTVTMNVCITDYRHRRALKRNRKTLSIDAPIAGTDDLRIEPPSKEVDPGSRVHHKDIGAAVKVAVEQLPDDFRQCVLLRDMQGLSYEEIAEILDIPIGTVMSRLHRGRKAMQKRLWEFAKERGLLPEGAEKP